MPGISVQAEYNCEEYEGQRVLSDLLGRDWTPQGSRVDPYEGIRDEATRAWIWGQIRHYVLERDGGQCQICGCVIKGGEEQVHHIVYRRYGGSDHPANLMTVDRSCHEAIHRRKVEIYEVL